MLRSGSSHFTSLEDPKHGVSVQLLEELKRIRLNNFGVTQPFQKYILVSQGRYAFPHSRT